MGKHIIANWKMNPSSMADAIALARALDAEGLVIAPPALYLASLRDIVKKSALGAQNIFWEEEGAYTGELSPAQLKDSGAQYVIVGHSERRALGETNEMVGKKIHATLAHGLTPILCVGETADEREAGQRDMVLKNEVDAAMKHAQGEHQMIIAYEPIWAIGSGTPSTPENALEAIRALTGFLGSYPHIGATFIYGGSVDAKTIDAFLAHDEIAGVLVGGASLDPEEMHAIMESAKRHA